MHVSIPFHSAVTYRTFYHHVICHVIISQSEADKVGDVVEPHISLFSLLVSIATDSKEARSNGERRSHNRSGSFSE